MLYSIHAIMAFIILKGILHWSQLPRNYTCRNHLPRSQRNKQTITQDNRSMFVVIQCRNYPNITMFSWKNEASTNLHMLFVEHCGFYSIYCHLQIAIISRSFAATILNINPMYVSPKNEIQQRQVFFIVLFFKLYR